MYSFDSVSFALVIFHLNDLLPPNNVRMKKKTLHKLLGILEDGIYEDLRNVCNHVIGDWCFLFAGNHGLQRARLGFWLDDWREGKPTRESASYLPGATQLSLIIFTTRLNPLNYSISKKKLWRPVRKLEDNLRVDIGTIILGLPRVRYF